VFVKQRRTRVNARVLLDKEDRVLNILDG